LVIASLTVTSTACSKTGKSSSNSAEIEAARMDGRNAAKYFANKQWHDTVELQQLLLEARANQSKYVTAGKEDCAAAYDSAFISTMRTVRPDIYKTYTIN